MDFIACYRAPFSGAPGKFLKGSPGPVVLQSPKVIKTVVLEFPAAIFEPRGTFKFAVPNGVLDPKHFVLSTSYLALRTSYKVGYYIVWKNIFI